MNKTRQEAWTPETAVAIMSVMQAAFRLEPEPTPEEHREAQRRAESKHNRATSLRTLLSLYEWRYALLPIGVAYTRDAWYDGNVGICVEARQLHVFGVRVARWVVKRTFHPLVSEPPKARLRLRPWRKKRGVS